jgi:hypothetical protein
MLTYYTKPDGKVDESMAVATRVRIKDWQMANMILDFREQKVLKAVLQNNDIPKDWDRIVGYYYPFYTNIIERLLQENGHKISNEAVVNSARS